MQRVLCGYLDQRSFGHSVSLFLKWIIYGHQRMNHNYFDDLLMYDINKCFRIYYFFKTRLCSLDLINLV